MNKVLYSLPTEPATKKGMFHVDNIFFQEIVKDPENDNIQEIDFDWSWAENIMIPTIKGNRMYEFHITFHLN